MSLVVTLAGLTSCTKDDDPEPSPVVGRWAIDRAKYSGFTGEFAGNNGREEDLSNSTLTGFSDEFEVKSDNTFVGTQRANGLVADYQGTWVFGSNQLTLKYDNGDEETLEFDNSRTPHKLTGTLIPTSQRFLNAARDTVLVNYNVQLIYAKKN